MSETQSATISKITTAVQHYAKQFSGFSEAVDTLDSAKTAYTEKAQAYETAKGFAVDALCKAMKESGFTQNGFNTASDKKEFMDAWKGTLHRPYAVSTQDRLWQELCTAATNRTGQKFGVHNPDSVKKAKQREEQARTQAAALKKLGIDEHTAPMTLRQKAQELSIADPATASIVLTEAMNREAKNKLADKAEQDTVMKNKREILRGMIANATMEQLDALLATAKQIKLNPKTKG